jgi:hypothetical protein
MLKRIEIIGLFLALGAIPALAGAAREEHTRTFQKTVPLASGQRLEIENKFGDVLVRTQPKPEVSINATIKASANDAAEAKSVAEKIVIDVRQSDAVLTVRTEYPQEHTLRNVSYSVSYDIVMPETAPLAIRNSFGAVVVTDLKANAAITNSHGKLVFRWTATPRCGRRTSLVRWICATGLEWCWSARFPARSPSGMPTEASS